MKYNIRYNSAMSKLDYLKDKSLNKREVFRIVGLTLIAALTGTVASAYSSFIGVAPVKAFWATALGFTATIFLAFLLRKFWIELEQIEEELKDV